MIYIVLAFLIFFGFKTGFWTGIIVSVLALGFVIYKAIPTVYAFLGNSAYNKDDEEKALAFYDKAVSTGRSGAAIAITYVLMLMRTGKMDKALSVVNNIIADRKTKLQEKYTAKQYRSLIYFKQGDKEEALQDAYEIFEECKNTTMYGLLGYLKLACDEPIPETLDFCKEAYDYNDEDRDIVDNLVLAYYKNGEYDKAEELASDLVEMSPKFVEAYYHSALIATAKGDNTKAKELLEHIGECTRTALTTVSEEEIDNLKRELEK